MSGYNTDVFSHGSLNAARADLIVSDEILSTPPPA
jgi:hypothetical protein